MGYDLTLRPREGRLDEAAFVEYFSELDEYEFPEGEPDVAAYFNRSTEVYFHFRHLPPGEEEPKGAIAFSINYYRPHVFALEAERELELLVEDLDLAVADPQSDGIEGDQYDGEAFLRGWNAGNRYAYRESAREDEEEGEVSAPLHTSRDRIERLWLFNYATDRIEEDNGGHYVASLVSFGRRPSAASELATFATVDVGTAALLPRVDLVCVTRGKDVWAFVPFEDVYEALGLSDEDMIAEPWDYWAATRTELERLDRFLRGKKEPAPIERVELGDVHATEDLAPFLDGSKR